MKATRLFLPFKNFLYSQTRFPSPVLNWCVVWTTRTYCYSNLCPSVIQLDSQQFDTRLYYFTLTKMMAASGTRNRRIKLILLKETYWQNERSGSGGAPDFRSLSWLRAHSWRNSFSFTAIWTKLNRTNRQSFTWMLDVFKNVVLFWLGIPFGWRILPIYSFR